ncbi:hypothetical protein BB561_004861 [Smittium simulii]|uniref:Uncharacterized protein n=1 Tax=Smittium simulii TaxID=133385 RepID=A0A2T9YDT1_9FUNG|nr:hypothetical protein BB561_004861 [Smittium simulii]
MHLEDDHNKSISNYASFIDPEFWRKNNYPSENVLAYNKHGDLISSGVKYETNTNICDDIDLSDNDNIYTRQISSTLYAPNEMKNTEFKKCDGFEKYYNGSSTINNQEYRNTQKIYSKYDSNNIVDLSEDSDAYIENIFNRCNRKEKTVSIVGQKPSSKMRILSSEKSYAFKKPVFRDACGELDELESNSSWRNNFDIGNSDLKSGEMEYVEMVCSPMSWD